MTEIRLGLIGDNIAASRSPDLHRIAGRLCGLDVSYELLGPREMGMDFETLFRSRADGSWRGVNVTYPYKEVAAGMVRIDDPHVRDIGAVNTVVFEDAGPAGHNTDYSGFIAAWRETFGRMAPGKVALIGAGGVGRATAFALAALGAEEIRITDRDMFKADRLAAAVPGAAACADAPAAAENAGGIVNCTPLGMTGNPDSPIPAEALDGHRWAFDAVYTPVETRFRADALAAGLKFMSGYELYFHQGSQAFRIFTGMEPPDLARLRQLLEAGDADTA
ncbi:MAG: shikimate dehydrogenase [Alphaproteobacteria bacterium]|nr:shikimate dehydrogenase [Alphaproteobacteria bacterium]